MACDVGDQRFEPKTFSLMYLIRLDDGPLAGARDDMLGVILLSEEAPDRHPQSGGNAMQHLQGRVCPTVLYLGEDGFGTARGFCNLLQRHGIQKARVSYLRSDANFSAKSVQSPTALGFRRGTDL